jgi:hypothetical protein
MLRTYGVPPRHSFTISARILRDIVPAMPPDPHVDRLMDKLLRAVEVSLRATEASREAVQEILKRGAETGIFFAGEGEREAGDGFDVAEQDRDFLRSLSIRPDPRA